jgi:MoxR-like ATPase
MMQKARELAVALLERISTDAVSREEITRKLTAEVSAVSVHTLLKGVASDVYIKKNPIIFDRVKLLKHLTGETLGFTAAPVAKASDHIHLITDDEAPMEALMLDATQDPSLDKFVPTRSYRLVERRMNPKYPINLFIFGETGVGKSTAPLHIGRKQHRPVIRVNLSRYTDIDDIFGGFRIVDGNMHFEKGPALEAFERGAILLMDEVDSADPQLLTDLHPILEARPYLIKKIKKLARPRKGFMVIATANTKGRGDLSGRYIGTGPLNRAFLDRFATSIHYEQPTPAELLDILMSEVPDTPETILDTLCRWYEEICNAVANSAVGEGLSPRKMINIATLMVADGVTEPKSAAAKQVIADATNLMDDHVSQALIELWDLIIRPRRNV